MHLKDACQFVPTGLVAYPKDSPMFEFVEKQKAKEEADRRAEKERQLKDTARQVTEKKPSGRSGRRPKNGPEPV